VVTVNDVLKEDELVVEVVDEELLVEVTGQAGGVWGPPATVPILIATASSASRGILQKY